MEVLHLVVGVLGNVASMFLYSAPITTFTRVARNRSTEEFSCIPYLISLLACVAYTWYSTPVLSFIIIFLRFAPGKEKVKVGAMFVLVLVISVVVVLVSIFIYHDHPHRKLFVGWVAIVTATSMYGSPLVAMKTVIETQSVEFMPFYLSFFTFLASALWSIYGLLELDFYIAAPNVIGTLLGMAQLVLYFKYNKKGGIKELIYRNTEKEDENLK
ncbi:hypothetical protein K2173_008540 [Erythroxylum novogranatense]|uniref:Bidirectional sugar transporter SWEET n=1 Tax=Erythroxylum novogranatense TaxID=1862640 RepID=A0AAV8SLM3_9ROSI|nr:hypothetical protein K2173_008540 [Erythroxylum novogranatense]